jgi:hypothetical protein
MDFVFGETLGDATPDRGAREERIYIRSRTSFLIGWFIGAVTLKGDEVKVDERRRAEVAVLKELAWFYGIQDPSLTTIRHGQRRSSGNCTRPTATPSTTSTAGGSFRAQQELLKITQSDDRRYRVATDFVAGLTEDLAYALYHPTDRRIARPDPRRCGSCFTLTTRAANHGAPVDGDGWRHPRTRLGESLMVSAPGLRGHGAKASPGLSQVRGYGVGTRWVWQAKIRLFQAVSG